jgi:DNA polymerase-1
VETAFAEGNALDYPVIDLLRLYRSITKRLGTYGCRWVNDSNWEDEKGNAGHLFPGTGRLHSYIDQLGAATGRTTSTKPNIQNLPREAEVRACFDAPEGYCIITLDFNGCELRLLAEMSGEKVLIAAFNAGWDVHSCGAEIIFGEEWKNAAEPGCKYYEKDHQKCSCKTHKKLRDQVKALNFGIMYGKGPYSFAQELGITKDEAEKILAKWKRAFPRATKFLEESGNSAKTNMECRTLSGRRRAWVRPTWDDAKKYVQESLPEGVCATSDQIRKKYGSMFSSIEREGKNGPIQGSNACIAKIAMYYIWQGIRKFGAFQVNFVHDENVIQCPVDTAVACKELVLDCMRRAGAILVKQVVMEAEGNIADCWLK